MGTLSREELLRKIHKIGAEVIRPAAASVDKEARFPREAFEALRAEKMLSVYVPEQFGGIGCSYADLAAICTALGQYCGSTAMIFAMHQIQVACIVRHGNTPYFQGYQRELVEKQLLMGSATTEEGIGGDVRTSSCHVARDGDSFVLEKKAPVISYGEEADEILVTARRGPDAASSDQSLVLVRKGDTVLERTHTWDTMGMRGTCSLGYMLKAKGHVDQILPVPYADLSAQTMHAVSHTLWTSLWLGIATDAVNQARAYIRAEARKKPGTVPPGAFRLAELVVELQSMRQGVQGATRDYIEIMDDRDALSGPSFTIRMNNLKIAASRQLVRLCADALQIVGITGYKADSKYSLARQLRDAYGAPLMIANDRILGNNSTLLLVAKDE